MARIAVSEERTPDAPADTVYRYVADFEALLRYDSSVSRYPADDTKFQHVRDLNLPLGQYAISSSGPLGVREIREIGDIDLVVDDDLWNELASAYPIIQEQAAPCPGQASAARDMRQIRALSWPDTLHKHARLGHSGATRGKRDPVTGPLLAHLELLLLC